MKEGPSKRSGRIPIGDTILPKAKTKDKVAMNG
jgi:hypothetical protein